MGHLSIFLNSKIEMTAANRTSLGQKSAAFGNFLLTPIRYLFDGKVIQVSIRDNTAVYVRSGPQQVRDTVCYKFLKVIASIIFLVPGLLLGTVFKGCGYASQTVCLSHRISVSQLQHSGVKKSALAEAVAGFGVNYGPTHASDLVTIGSETERVELPEIERRLKALKDRGPIKVITIYAAQNVYINTDPGLLALEPEKIILVGTRIVHRPGTRLDDAFNEKWDVRFVREGSNADMPYQTFVRQYRVSSVEQAIRDVPPPNPKNSNASYKRVYIMHSLRLGNDLSL